MIRAIGILLCGIFLIFGGVRGIPEKDVNKSGWLYQWFGQSGPAGSMIIFGVVSLIIGAWMFAGSWRDMREQWRYNAEERRRRRSRKNE